MKRLRIRAWWEELYTSFFNRKGRELFVFLFFFAISSYFWLLQTLDETFESEVSIPVVLVDIPEDIIVTTPFPDNIVVTVKDKGTVLLRYWRHKLPAISFSFTDYNKGKNKGVINVPKTEVQKVIQGHLYPTSKIQSFSPSSLEMYYNHGSYTKMPVKVAGEVTVDPHYYLLDLDVSPSEVKVYAPQSILDTLTTVLTEPLSITNLQEDVSKEVALCPIRGVKFEPSHVTFSAKLDVYMENTVEIPIVPMNFPGGKQLRTFPSTIKVTYTVGYARNNDIKPDNFVSVVTYDEILELQKKGVARIPVQIKSIPDDVTNVRIEPGEVDYLIESTDEEE